MMNSRDRFLFDNRQTAGKYHILKTWPKEFRSLAKGEKTFEVRKNDRGFNVGDILILREWCPKTKKYSGSICERQVIHILEGGQFGIEKEYVVMSLIVF